MNAVAQTNNNFDRLEIATVTSPSPELRIRTNSMPIDGLDPSVVARQREKKWLKSQIMVCRKKTRGFYGYMHIRTGIERKYGVPIKSHTCFSAHDRAWYLFYQPI